jgi:nickel/cobalt exporter
VFALGFVTLALSQFIVPADLYPWLNLVSALLVVGVGIAVLRARLRSWSHAHARGHLHDHDHAHGHTHVPLAGSGLRGLLSVGISGGILPCPTALVVLLAAISLHRVGYGLVLILAFSLGLAASVTGIGLVAVSAKRFFARTGFDGRVIRALPAVSALVVLGLGLAMTFRALPSLP